VRQQPHPKDAELVAVIARELGGPIRIASLVEESQRQAATDPLTGLMNRRAFKSATVMEIARSERHGYPVSALLLDVDHFKEINDHRATPPATSCWPIWGGCSPARSARSTSPAAGAARSSWCCCPDPIATGRCWWPSASAPPPPPPGSRTRPASPSLHGLDRIAFYYSGEGIESLLGRADAGMYLAKSAGRNRVMLGPDGRRPRRSPRAPRPSPPAPTPILSAAGGR
jgi:GGDEF domain-containing protein